jgi:hypothetical protein
VTASGEICARFARSQLPDEPYPDTGLYENLEIFFCDIQPYPTYLSIPSRSNYGFVPKERLGCCHVGPKMTKDAMATLDRVTHTHQSN